MTSASLLKHIVLDNASLTRLCTAMFQLNLSVRAYDCILRDSTLKGSESIKPFCIYIHSNGNRSTVIIHSPIIIRIIANLRGIMEFLN